METAERIIAVAERGAGDRFAPPQLAEDDVRTDRDRTTRARIRDAAVARFAAHDDAPAAQAARAWDLDALAGTNRSWQRFAAELLDAPEQHLDPAATPPVTEDERAFAVRSLLVHEWRKFLFTDPGLPAELLPIAWAEDDGVLMGMHHVELPYWGVQFHPESVLTGAGRHLLGNFLQICRQHREHRLPSPAREEVVA